MAERYETDPPFNTPAGVPVVGSYSTPLTITTLVATLVGISGISQGQIEAILKGNILANTIDPPKDMVPGGHFAGLEGIGHGKDNLYSAIGKTVNLTGTKDKLEEFINFVISGPGGRLFRPVNRDQTHYIQEYLANPVNTSIFPQASNPAYPHKLDVPRVTGTTGYNPRLTNLYVSYDNSTKDIVANPRYIATLGTLGDPSTRDWKDMLFLMPGPLEKMDNGHQYKILPMRYVAQAGLAHIITAPPSIEYNFAYKKWTITIPINGGYIKGPFDSGANPIPIELDGKYFQGNNEKNAAISVMLNEAAVGGAFKLDECTKYLLIKIIGDLFQVMCILYLFHVESERSKTEIGFTLKYHEGNTVVTTSDIIVLYRCWLNNVPVIHTDQKGKSTLWMPNIQTPESLVNITKDMIDCIVTRVIGNNMSVINTFQAVIDSAPTGTAAVATAVATAVADTKSIGIFRPKREPRAKAAEAAWLESTWGSIQLANGVAYLHGMIKILIEQNKIIMNKFAKEKGKVLLGQPNTHVSALVAVKRLAAESNFLNPFSKKDSQHYKRNSGISFILPNKKIKFGLSSTMSGSSQEIALAESTMVGGVKPEILARMGAMGYAAAAAAAAAAPVNAEAELDGAAEDELDGAANVAHENAAAAPAVDDRVAANNARARARGLAAAAAERVPLRREYLPSAEETDVKAMESLDPSKPNNLCKAVFAAIQGAEYDDRDHIKYADDTMPLEWLINVEYFGGIRTDRIPYIAPRDKEIRMIQQPVIDRKGNEEVNDELLYQSSEILALDDPFNADASSERLLERVRSGPNCHLITQYLITVAKESIRLLIENIASEETYSNVNIGDLNVPGTAVAHVQQHARTAIQDAIDGLEREGLLNEVNLDECSDAARGSVEPNISSIIRFEFNRINNKNRTGSSVEAKLRVVPAARAAAPAEAAPAEAAAAGVDPLANHIRKCYKEPYVQNDSGTGSPGLLNKKFKSAFSFVYVRQFHPEVFTLANCMAIGLGFNKTVGSNPHKMTIADFENIDEQKMYDIPAKQSSHYNLRNDEPYYENQDPHHREYKNNLRKSTSLAVKYTKYIIQAYPHLGTSSLKTFLNLFRKRPYSSMFQIGIDKYTLGAAAEVEDTRAALVAQGMLNAPAAPAVGSSSGAAPVSRGPPRMAVQIYSSRHAGVASADDDEKYGGEKKRGGGGNDDILSDEELHERLPQAVEIAIHIYEIIYALTMRASLLDKNIYELVEDLKEYISYYDEGIKEMKDIPVGSIDEEKRQEQLNVLEYERSVIEDVLVPRFEKHNSKSVPTPATTPVVKVAEASSKNTIQIAIPKTKRAKVFNKFNRTPLKKNPNNISNNISNNNSNNQLISEPVVAPAYDVAPSAAAAAAGGSRFKKTRKNRKLKKLKQSYKKTRSALRKSRKH